MALQGNEKAEAQESSVAGKRAVNRLALVRGRDARGAQMHQPVCVVH